MKIKLFERLEGIEDRFGHNDRRQMISETRSPVSHQVDRPMLKHAEAGIRLTPPFKRYFPNIMYREFDARGESKARNSCNQGPRRADFADVPFLPYKRIFSRIFFGILREKHELRLLTT